MIIVKYYIFGIQVILTVLIVWFLCFILTLSGALPSGNPARTDINSDILRKSKWFRIPYPCNASMLSYDLIICNNIVDLIFLCILYIYIYIYIHINIYMYMAVM